MDRILAESERDLATTEENMGEISGLVAELECSASASATGRYGLHPRVPSTIESIFMWLFGLFLGVSNWIFAFFEPGDDE
jgi:hypothetical protein